MKYTVSNIINNPLDEVIAKFTEPDGAKHWMEGLQKIVRHSGQPLSVGAESEFHFLYKGKEMIIGETILEQDLPRQIKFGFTSQMGYNEVEMLFEELPNGTTKQINNSYFEMKGFMKLMGFFMKGMFKKQSQTYLDGFKKYVEG